MSKMIVRLYELDEGNEVMYMGEVGESERGFWELVKLMKVIFGVYDDVGELDELRERIVEFLDYRKGEDSFYEELEK